MISQKKYEKITDPYKYMETYYSDRFLTVLN
jgi:hypothetical protein